MLAGWRRGKTYKDCISIKIVILPAGSQSQTGGRLPGEDVLLQGEPHQAVPHPQGEAGDVHQTEPGGGAGGVSPGHLEVLGGEARTTGRVWGRYQLYYFWVLELQN